ncbi:MAG: SNF2-related protein [Parachlamydiales bacterium]
MLNFRRLKQDFPPSILQDGRELHTKGVVQSARILKLESTSLRIAAVVQGAFDNFHSCEVEIDRAESELTDSTCNCAHHCDCQHLAAILFHLEEHLDGLIVEFSQEGELEVEEEELQEAIEEAHKKESERKGVLLDRELLGEYQGAAAVLEGSPFFTPQEKPAVDRAELAVIFYGGGELGAGQEVELSVALRLPFRSKPLHIPNLQAFCEAIRFDEPQVIGEKRYYFTGDSFSSAQWEILSQVVGATRFLQGSDEKTLKMGRIDKNGFGMLLASAFDQVAKAPHSTGEERVQELPSLYAGSLDVPLRCSLQVAILYFGIETLKMPAPKCFLRPSVRVAGEVRRLDELVLLPCQRPGLVCGATYYRFAPQVTRAHLAHLKVLEAMTLPEPLFGTFIENSLPELKRFAEVGDEELIEGVETLPFAEELKGRCAIEYLDGELEARLEFQYEERFIPAHPAQPTSEQMVAFVTEEGVLARDLVAERTIAEELFQGFDFDPTLQTWVAKNEKRIVEFMTELVPKYQDRITFDCPQNLLDRFLYDDTTYTLKCSESERVDVYQIELKVDGHLSGTRVDRLWESIAARRTFLELDKGEGARSKRRGAAAKGPKILVLDLDRLAPVVQIFDEIGIKVLDDETLERPLWSLAGISKEAFEGLPVKMTMSKALKDIQKQILEGKGVDPSPVPQAIRAELRPYQLEGVHWLERLRTMHLNGVLADDMGLGKTLQAIVAITQFLQKNPKQQSLIVCPTSLLYNWQEEFTKFNPDLKVQVIDGSPAQRTKLLTGAKGCDILITSYSLLQKDVEQYEKRPFGYVILDEAQHIKNRGTRNAKSAKQVKAAHKLILTGTPIENSLEELWSLFDFLMPGLLSTYDRFVEKYIRASGHSHSKGLESLSRKVAPFILRRMKADVLKDLPPVSEIVYHCHLTPKQRELYHSYAASAREELYRLVEKEGFDKVQIHVLATLTRLKQICCHPAIFAKEGAEEGDSAKYDMLLELLGSLIEGGHKTVIFSQYTRMLGIIREDLEKMGIRFVYLDGSSKNRLELVHQFNEDASIPIFLVSLKAGGTGLNLTAADTVIHYDMWWNPAVESQATDRVHRLGQKRAVSSCKLITMGTIEEKIVEMQNRKKGLVKKVVSCDDEAVSKLTWEEVLELLQV